MMPTTAPVTDASAHSVRRMGYAVRIQAVTPTGRTDDVDLALVAKACKG